MLTMNNSNDINSRVTGQPGFKMIFPTKTYTMSNHNSWADIKYRHPYRLRHFKDYR